MTRQSEIKTLFLRDETVRKKKLFLLDETVINKTLFLRDETVRKTTVGGTFYLTVHRS